MNQNGIRDGVNEAVGRVRDTADQVLSDTGDKLKGGLRQTANRAQGAYGDALESLESSTRERPLPVLALALGIGLIIGLLSFRR